VFASVRQKSGGATYFPGQIKAKSWSDSIQFESKGRSERESHHYHNDDIEQTNGMLQ